MSVDAPTGTKLTVDGAEVAGEAPFPEPLDVEAGKHLLGAKLGEASKSLDVSAGAGETVPAKVVFDVPVVVGPGPGPGTPDAGTQPPVPPPEEKTGGSGKMITVVVLATGAVAGLTLGAYLAERRRHGRPRGEEPAARCRLREE